MFWNHSGSRRCRSCRSWKVSKHAEEYAHSRDHRHRVCHRFASRFILFYKQWQVQREVRLMQHDVFVLLRFPWSRDLELFLERTQRTGPVFLLFANLFLYVSLLVEWILCTRVFFLCDRFSHSKIFEVLVDRTRKLRHSSPYLADFVAPTRS